MTIRIIDEIKSGRWFSLEDYPMEKWADVVDYKGIYMISNYGRLKHLPYSIYGLNADRIDVEAKIRKPNLMNKGYYCYELWKNNKRKVYLLHRLLAIAFIQNPNNLPQINHKDGDKRNNNISNLEWCTAKENIVHAFRVLGRVSPQKGKRGKDCCHSTPVCALNKNGEVVMVFESMQEAYRQTGIMESGISRCINGKKKTAGGFLWKLWFDRPEDKKSHITVDAGKAMQFGSEPLARIERNDEGNYERPVLVCYCAKCGKPYYASALNRHGDGLSILDLEDVIDSATRDGDRMEIYYGEENPLKDICKCGRRKANENL